MYPAESDAERVLREHIRHLLLDYALTHLTTDHIAYTQDTVRALLSQSLFIIPTTDPNSLILPEEPFDTLSRILGLSSLEPYDQKWSIEPPSAALIKKTLTLPENVKPVTERCWDTNNDFNYQRSIYRPMSPLLTTRAMRQTKLRPSVEPKPNIQTHADFLPSVSIKSIAVEDSTEPPPLQLDELLKLKPAIDAETHASMLPLFKTVPALSRPPAEPHVSHHVTEFLSRRTPPPSTLLLIPMSPPIFPKNRMTGAPLSIDDSSYANPPSGLRALSDLPPMLPEVKMEDEEGELYKEHMVIVDGWQAFASSPSPSRGDTPSLADSSSQVDELSGFLPSPPNVVIPAIQTLTAAKMDETEIPRTRKIGGAREKPKVLGEGTSLSSFLSPFLPSRPPSHPHIVSTPKSQPSSPRTTISLSVLGQPPSAHGDIHSDDATHVPELDSDDIDVVIGGIYKSLRGKDPKDFIMQERLEEKDGLLMDVPILPEPNVHQSISVYHPASLPNLLAPSVKRRRDEAETVSHDQCGYLKKTKGIAPLNIELSWIPFKYHIEKPTTEDLVQVSDDSYDGGAITDYEREQVKTLLRQIDLHANCSISPSVHPRDFTASWENPVDAYRKFYGDSADGFEMILTRDERRRLAGIPERALEFAESDLEHSDKENEEHGDDAVRATRNEIPRPLNQLERASVNSSGQAGDDDSGVSFVPYMAHAHSGSQTHFDDDENPSFFEVPDGAKENMPPGANFHSHVDSRHVSLQSQDDHDHAEFDHLLRYPSPIYEEDYEHGGFVPLSFGSHGIASAYPSQVLAQGDVPAEQGAQAAAPDALGSPIPAINPPEDPASPGLCRAPDCTSANFVPGLSYANPGPHSLSEFMEMRAKPIKALHLQSPGVDHNSSDSVDAIPEDVVECLPPTFPPDLLDHNTLTLPSNWKLPSSLHRYMSSMDLIQKQGLVRSLKLRECAVELVERENLGGVDLILDPHTAVIFFSLPALPSQCDVLNKRLSQQSWRYSRILVVFEAFPPSHLHARTRSSRIQTPNVYSPPVLKAVRKLRRDLGIAEAYEVKRVEITIYFAFANTVDEAALFARMFGDDAEASDNTGSALWGDREWLNGDEEEDEQDLAGMNGMNTFAAFVILHQRSPQEFLDLTPEARILEMGNLVGEDRIALLNRELESRFLAIQDIDSMSIDEAQGLTDDEPGGSVNG